MTGLIIQHIYHFFCILSGLTSGKKKSYVRDPLEIQAKYRKEKVWERIMYFNV